jgi:hypothetical protein
MQELANDLLALSRSIDGRGNAQRAPGGVKANEAQGLMEGEAAEAIASSALPSESPGSH